MLARLVCFPSMVLVMVALARCSGFTASDECEPGETSTCDTQCGPGTRTCQGDGTWGVCEMTGEPECLPGEYGSCELLPEAPPGLWFCSDDCRRGPCRDLCMPGETFECEAECGPGVRTCTDEGSWGPCREYVLPLCRPGEIVRCADGEGHRRCNEGCTYDPCDAGAPCTPGEVSDCGRCASQVCRDDGTWSECSADIWAVCSPDQVEACEAPCGPGQRVCTDACEWTPCEELEPVPCHPGNRQICPTTLYCGLAFRVCRSDCTWGECLEVGD